MFLYLRKEYPREEYAKHLRKVQSSFWALKQYVYFDIYIFFEFTMQ